MNDTVVEIGADGPDDGPVAPTPLDATGADSFARDAEHLFAEVEGGDVAALLGEQERDIARTAAKIEDAIAGLRSAQLPKPTFPESVQAEALKVVDEVVAPGDPVEQLVYLRGPLGSGLEILVAHFASVSNSGRSVRASRKALS